MNFMNVGPLELTVILIIAILTIGPKRMVETFRAISRMTAQLRRFSREFTSTLQAEVMATERAVGESPENTVQSLAEPITSLQNELVAVGREARQALKNVVEGEVEPIIDVQAELETTAREAAQALEQEEIEIDAENTPLQED